MKKLKQGRTFMCGDFNLAPDTSIDVKGSSAKKICQSALIPFLQANGLFDIWRWQHFENGLLLSFQSPTALNPEFS